MPESLVVSVMRQHKVALLALHQLVLDGIPRGRAGPPRLALNPVHRAALLPLSGSGCVWWVGDEAEPGGCAVGEEAPLTHSSQA